MNTKLTFQRIATWILACLPLVALAVLYLKLPQQVPTNWGFDGMVSYSDKSTLWLISAMSPLCILLFTVLPRIDPKKRNYTRFSGSYEAFQLVFAIFMLVLQAVTLLETFRPGSANVTVVVLVMVSLLFIFVGNIMPKFRQNFFCGIRTPWTISSERVWVKTHRLGGRMFCLAGVAGLVGCLLPNEFARFALFIGAVIAASLLPLVMSYVWYRQEQPEHPQP